MPSHGSSLPGFVNDANRRLRRSAVRGARADRNGLFRPIDSRCVFSATTVAIGVVSVIPHASMKRMPYFCSIPFDKLPRQRRAGADDGAKARNIVFLIFQKDCIVPSTTSERRR